MFKKGFLLLLGSILFLLLTQTGADEKESSIPDWELPDWKPGDKWKYEVKYWVKDLVADGSDPWKQWTGIYEVEVLGVVIREDEENTWEEIPCWKLDYWLEGEKKGAIGGGNYHYIVYIRQASFTLLCIEEYRKDEKIETATRHNRYGDEAVVVSDLTFLFDWPKFPKKCKNETRKIKKRILNIFMEELPIIVQEVKFLDYETMEAKLTLELATGGPAWRPVVKKEECPPSVIWRTVVWQKWKKGKPWWVEYWREDYDKDGNPVPYSKIEAKLIEEDSTSTSKDDKDDGEEDEDSEAEPTKSDSEK